jgi:hypothetical protein
MLIERKNPKRILVIRWIARTWSIAVLILALIIAFSPDEHATGEPLEFREIFMLSLWGIAILGLLLAWRWELVGATITIVTMVFREIAFIIFYREWTVNFLLIWVAVIPPAVLFLLAWNLERKVKLQV